MNGRQARWRSGRQPIDLRLRQGAGFGVDGQQIGQIVRLGGAQRLQSCMVDRVDLVEAQPLVQKGGHGHLVGSVEHRSRAGRARQRLPGQAQAGKTPIIRLLEAQRAQRGEVQRGRARDDALGPRQAIGDGSAHVRRAQLGHHRAVGVLHHRMDHALGVDHHLDLRCGQAEQVAGLDDLERLVHHGGGVDRNLATHHPVGMGAGLVRGHPAQRVRVAGAERPARGREHDLFHPTGPGGRVFRQGLEHRGVLAVNGQKGRPAFAHRLHEEFAPHHERFLVRQQQFLARARGGQAGGQAGRADNRRHHRVHAGVAADVAQCLRARQHLDRKTEFAHARRELLRMGCTGHDGVTRGKTLALRQDHLHLRRGGERKHGVALRVACHHVERAGADGTGGAQDGDGLGTGHGSDCDEHHGQRQHGQQGIDAVPCTLR
eukprot:Opistho-1_new@80667